MMDEYDDVRAKLTEIIQRYGLRPTDIARDVGLHHSSLALWMQEKIKGHKVEIDKAIANFLDSFLANKCRWNSHLPKLALLKANKEFDECNVPSYDDADSLIPIKLDLEYEDKQLKDAFIWDKREQYLTVDMFARILVEEHNLPPIFEQEVINEMKKKLTLSTRYISGECIKTININVRIGEIIVRDQFEWDICNTENSPEV
jgi:transcriptional regulator with XRE-family HTH domain